MSDINLPLAPEPDGTQDVDLPLNTTATYTATHVFSTNDIAGTFGGLTQGDVLPGETPVIDFTADPKVTKEGVDLYPINSEFGYIVTDFIGAVEKTFDGNPEYEEGWAGDLKNEFGEQTGLVVSDSPTDVFLTPARLGTWLVGMGGESIKASTEHYSVMQALLSDQDYSGDPDALYPLDDTLTIVGGTYDGWDLAEAIADAGDVNGDDVADIKDVLAPNETTITENIAVGDDYSVSVKDDGKVLYRWGNAIKKPNDIRIEAEIALPDEWKADTSDATGLQPLYIVSQAELVVRHTITNNPNDQIRPEDYENEAATGTLPTYEILPDGKWVSTDDYYAGDGTFYPAGTVLKDPALAAEAVNSALFGTGALSTDMLQGFTNAWYQTMDREPFEPVLNPDGTDYEVGPRWRLKSDKYGQDLPSVTIPVDPSLQPPPTQDQVKYDVGAETQTVINLKDWATISPLTTSMGWLNAAGTVSINGMNYTDNFDVAFYVKGDQKPATLYDATLVMSYEEATINAEGAAIDGTAGDDVLVGMGGNTFTGLGGEDLFVLSYGTTENVWLDANVVTDFEVGVDLIGLLGLDVNNLNIAETMTQAVVNGNLEIYLDGYLIATLNGITEELDLTSFQVLTQQYGAVASALIIGTDGDDVLIGDEFDNKIVGLAGDDNIQGLGGNDNLIGQTGRDSLFGGDGDDRLSGDSQNDTLSGGAGNDNLLGGTASDLLAGDVGADLLTGGADADVFDYNAISDSVGGGGRDTILDFEVGIDLIDLSGIDADTSVDGDQAFTFIGNGTFSGAAGELRVVAVGTDCVVRGDINGDAIADIAIYVTGHTSLAVTDFIL